MKVIGPTSKFISFLIFIVDIIFFDFSLIFFINVVLIYFQGPPKTKSQAITLKNSGNLGGKKFISLL